MWKATFDVLNASRTENKILDTFRRQGVRRSLKKYLNVFNSHKKTKDIKSQV